MTKLIYILLLFPSFLFAQNRSGEIRYSSVICAGGSLVDAKNSHIRMCDNCVVKEDNMFCVGDSCKLFYDTVHFVVNQAVVHNDKDWYVHAPMPHTWVEAVFKGDRYEIYYWIRRGNLYKYISQDRLLEQNKK